MHVLVVEDDLSVSHWLGSKLRASGHNFRLVDTGEGALKMLENEAFDVVVLDRMLPKMDGIEMLKRLGKKMRPPVLILSANDQSSDRVEGLRAGADDYLGKPFNYDELLLRLELLAKRHGQTIPIDSIQIGDLLVDLRKHNAHLNGDLLDLTDKEYKLLVVLAERKGQTVTRSMLLEKVWGYHFDPQTNLIDVHLSNLRNKIDQGCSVSMIRTVRAIGYILG